MEGHDLLTRSSLEDIPRRVDPVDRRSGHCYFRRMTKSRRFPILFATVLLPLAIPSFSKAAGVPPQFYKIGASAQVVMSLGSYNYNGPAPVDAKKAEAIWGATLAQVRAALGGVDDTGAPIKVTVVGDKTDGRMVGVPDPSYYRTCSYKAEGVFWNPRTYPARVKSLGTLSRSLPTRSGTYKFSVGGDTVVLPMPAPQTILLSTASLSVKFIPVNVPKIPGGLKATPAPGMNLILDKIHNTIMEGLGGVDSTGQALSVGVRRVGGVRPLSEKYAPETNEIVFFTNGSFTERDGAAYAAKVRSLSSLGFSGSASAGGTLGILRAKVSTSIKSKSAEQLPQQAIP